LFPAGAEFMCTKTKKSKGILHIWLREIRTGLSENVIIWADDELFQAAEGQNTPTAELIQFIQAHGFQRNIQFVLKDSTETALAFIRSKIFAQSFVYAKNVKLMTDNTRPGEKNEKYGDEAQYLAGPLFIKETREYLGKTFQKKDTLKALIFCGDTQKCAENCQ